MGSHGGGGQKSPPSEDPSEEAKREAAIQALRDWLREHREDLAARSRERGHPQSIEEAVDRLLATLSDDFLAKIRDEDVEKLGIHHMGLGRGIRNRFGLWSWNMALLEECGGGEMADPDWASAVIIRALWERLHGSGGRDAGTSDDAGTRTGPQASATGGA